MENQTTQTNSEEEKVELNNSDDQTENATDKNASEATEQNDEYKSKYLYLAAEMENMKRRFDREKQDLLKYGSEKLLKELIAVVDNFERTVDALGADQDEKVKNIVTGINMIHKQFLDSLKKFGLEQIQSLGEEFDPNYHEAMAQQPDESKKDMEVLQEFEKGYLLNGRLLRPSKVIVAKN